MSKLIEVPILKNKFQSNESIGSLKILESELPKEPNFVFSIAYRKNEDTENYELKAVAIVSDEEFEAYLKEQRNLAEGKECICKGFYQPRNCPVHGN